MSNDTRGVISGPVCIIPCGHIMFYVGAGLDPLDMTLDDVGVYCPIPTITQPITNYTSTKE